MAILGRELRIHVSPCYYMGKYIENNALQPFACKCPAQWFATPYNSSTYFDGTNTDNTTYTWTGTTDTTTNAIQFVTTEWTAKEGSSMNKREELKALRARR